MNDVFEATKVALMRYFGSLQPWDGNGARATNPKRGKLSLYHSNLATGNLAEVAFDPVSIAQRLGKTIDETRLAIQQARYLTGRPVKENPRYQWVRVGLATSDDVTLLKSWLKSSIPAERNRSEHPANRGGKYAPLIEHLKSQPDDVEQITLSFAQIEGIINASLPASARSAPQAWWQNSGAGDTHTWAHQWMAAGWKSGGLSRTHENVTFSRYDGGAIRSWPIAQGRRAWWVNHKQTHKSEIVGGYMWSPKLKANGVSNQSYKNLTLVRAGDTIFSYADGAIRAVGIALSGCVDHAKPEEFGAAGDAWASDGWLVSVSWALLQQPISPKSHLSAIQGHLPHKFSPIQAETGNGNQGVYLAAIPIGLKDVLLRIAGIDGAQAMDVALDAFVDKVADEAENAINSADIEITEKEQLVRSRRGQGIFKTRVSQLETKCRLTAISDSRFLIASHIKPWSACNNAERLDGQNGLLLAPHADRLFDRGWISFDDDGAVLIAADAVRAVMDKWGLGESLHAGAFTPTQRKYLSYHRQHVYRGTTPVVP